MKRYFAFLACDEHGITRVADFQTIRACTCCPKAAEGLWKLPTYLWRPLNVSKSMWNLFKSFFWIPSEFPLREFPLKVPTKIPRKSPRKIPRFLKVTRRLINYWMSLEVCRKIFDIIFGNSPRLRKDSTSFCEGFGRIVKFSKASDSLWRILKATEVSGNRWKNSENFWRSLEAPEDSENFWGSSGNLWRTVKASNSF